MDGALVHLVNDPCTPAVMARAGVPLDVAIWYHAKGRTLSRYSEAELAQLLTVRSMVRDAIVH